MSWTGFWWGISIEWNTQWSKKKNFGYCSQCYIHCDAHNLNLVLSDVARSTTKFSSFFDTVQEIFNFFSKSGPRWGFLTFGDNVANIMKKKVLKKVYVTRWEARHEAVYALKDRYIDVLK